MAKTVNIGRLSVDFLANTTTYKAQLQQLSVETDKRLIKLENANKKHNKKVLADDKQANNQQKKNQSEIDKMHDLAIKEEIKRQNRIQRVREAAAQKAQRSSRMRAQQAGFQLQDAVVQAQMGIDASVIVAQQGSQFLGAMGATGAILGSVLALGAVAFGVISKMVSGAKVEVTDFNKEVKTMIDNMIVLDKTSKFTKTEDLVFGDTAKAQIKDYDKAIKTLTKDLEKAKSIARGDTITLIDSPRLGTITRDKTDADRFKEQKAINAVNNKLEKAKEIRKSLTRVVEAQTAEERKAIVTAGEMINKAKEELKIAGLTKRQKEEKILLLAGVTEAERKAHHLRMQDIESRNKQLETQQRNAQSIKETIENLRQQNREYGRSETSLALYRASLKGATEEQLKEIGILTQKIELMKKETAERKAAESLVKSLSNSETSPKAKLESDRRKLLQADAKGLIKDQESLAIALFNIEVKLQKMILDENKKTEQEKDRIRQEELRKEEALTRAKRTFQTDWYNFKRNQTMTDVQRLMLENKRELDLLTQKYKDGLKLYEEDLKKKQELKNQYDDAIAESEKNLNIEKTKIMMGDMDTIASAFGKQLALQQTFTQATIALNEGVAISQTLSDPAIPFYTKAIAVVSMIAQFAKLRNMMSNSGQFHGGTDEVPESMNNKSFILKAGERVVQPEANKKLTKFLDEDNNISPQTKIEQNITMGPSLVDKKQFDKALAQSASSLTSIVQREQKVRSSRTRSR